MERERERGRYKYIHIRHRASGTLGVSGLMPLVPLCSLCNLSSGADSSGRLQPRMARTARKPFLEQIWDAFCFPDTLVVTLKRAKKANQSDPEGSKKLPK